jgi:hypothetical protein
MTPEGKVKAYLRDRIRALGGEVRFAKWIARRNCPDCRVMFPGGELIRTVKNPWPFSQSFRAVRNVNCWVETKAPGKRPRPGQAREIKRMREMGEVVFVLPTIEDIDREFPL